MGLQIACQETCNTQLRQPSHNPNQLQLTTVQAAALAVQVAPELLVHLWP